MTTPNADIHTWWRPIRSPARCAHFRGIYFPETTADRVRRACRFCGLALADAEPRCTATIVDGSRRCLAPARHDGLCRAHHGRAAA